MAEVDGATNNSESTADMAAVQDFIKAQVKANFDELSAQQQQQQQQGSGDQEKDATARVRDFIKPIFQGDLDQAQLAAADARDYVSFYRTNSDALGMEQQVEETFTALVKAGRPTTRADVFRYLVGKEALEHPDKFAERQAAQKKKELDRAGYAADIGATADQREKADTDFKSFPDRLATAGTNSDELHSLVTDMEKALAGVTF